MYVYLIFKQYSNGATTITDVIGRKARAELLLEDQMRSVAKDDGWEVSPWAVPHSSHGEVVGDTYKVVYHADQRQNTFHWIEKHKVG